MTAWFAPGRIEVLGKHTDYAGGNVLVCAVDRGITATVLPPRGDGITAVSDLDGHTVDLTPGTPDDLPAGHWGRYLRATTARLAANFGPLRPAHVQISSTLPPASGMSSSSALIVATALALVDHNGFRDTPAWRDHITDDVALAGYLACIENGRTFGGLAGTAGVGTLGGSEDHTAMTASRPGQLAWFAFDPPRALGRVPLPDDVSFVVAVSGVAAEKTGAARDAYNAASQRARDVLARWNDAGHDEMWLAGAVDTAGADAVRAVVADDPALVARLDQFVTESTRCVPDAVEALRAGSLAGFGAAVARSQDAAHAGLANQVPETITLVDTARSLGAHAASSFGAGFGGSVWALVDSADAHPFAAHWLDAYLAQHPEHADRASTLVTRPSGPAQRVDGPDGAVASD